MKSALKIASEKEVTIDEIVAEADLIWKKVKKENVLFGDEEGANKVMAKIQQEHREFCTAYPIVNRYICQMHEYSSHAFKRWLLKIKQHPWKSEDEYYEAQADYVTKLFRARNPKCTATQWKNVRTNVRTQLLEERDSFKAALERYQKEIECEEKNRLAKNKDELYALMQRLGVDGVAQAETVRVEGDESTRANSVVYDSNIGTNNITAGPFAALLED